MRTIITRRIACGISPEQTRTEQIKGGIILAKEIKRMEADVVIAGAGPGAPGRPPALTVVTLGKRLARHLETLV